jgi:hypothetical protein
MKTDPELYSKISDLRDEAKRMVEAGEMPPLEELLKVIGEVREEFREKILEARKAKQ